MRLRWKLAAAVSATVLGLTACSPVGVQEADPEPAAETNVAADSQGAEETSEPTPTPTPEPTPEPWELEPGTNHNYAAAEYAYPTVQVQEWVKDQTLAPKKIVFLTFDDGPNNVITPVILDELQDAGVHATFFILGSNIKNAPEVLERTLEEGNAIALHSWSHDYKALYPGRSADADRVAKEFDQTLEGVREVLGEDFDSGSWRYPGGHMSWKNLDDADAALMERGAAWIDWNAMTGDAEPKKRRPSSVSAMVSMATSPISQGVEVVVLLAHDTNDKQMTADAVPDIIAAYKEAGYEFGVLS